MLHVGWWRDRHSRIPVPSHEAFSLLPLECWCIGLAFTFCFALWKYGAEDYRGQYGIWSLSLTHCDYRPLRAKNILRTLNNEHHVEFKGCGYCRPHVSHTTNGSEIYCSVPQGWEMGSSWMTVLLWGSGLVTVGIHGDSEVNPPSLAPLCFTAHPLSFTGRCSVGDLWAG